MFDDLIISTVKQFKYFKCYPEVVYGAIEKSLHISSRIQIRGPCPSLDGGTHSSWDVATNDHIKSDYKG